MLAQSGRKLTQLGYWSRRIFTARHLRYRHRAHVLGYLVTLLNCRTRRDRFVPALHIRVPLQVDRLPFETGDPWPDRDVCDGVLIGDEFATLEDRKSTRLNSSHLVIS